MRMCPALPARPPAGGLQVQQAVRALATSMLQRKGGCHLARAEERAHGGGSKRARAAQQQHQHQQQQQQQETGGSTPGHVPAAAVGAQEVSLTDVARRALAGELLPRCSIRLHACCAAPPATWHSVAIHT